MAGSRKDPNVWQYGDFQTPPPLAEAVCKILVRRGVVPGTIIEPTCGSGAFLSAAARVFAGTELMFGLELNPAHVRRARAALATARIEQGDFFTFAWSRLLANAAAPVLVLGNPPWVTNSDLGLLASTNLPDKTSQSDLVGLAARTGAANFDISESMLQTALAWLTDRSGWLAMLVKTSVARKVLKGAWQAALPVGRAAIHRIDARRHFQAATDACLLVIPVGLGQSCTECDVFASLDATEPETVIGFHDQMLVADAAVWRRWRHLIGADTDYCWRSGIKHDCARVMEFTSTDSGRRCNGLGEEVELEPAVVFPLLKSSDIANGRSQARRFVLVCQQAISQDPAAIAKNAPAAWNYLLAHAESLAARKSSVYRNRPRFSIFGVGPYTFTPWKVAVAGLYKSPHFVKVGPVAGQPVVFDDTVYFLPCQSEAQADFVLSLVTSRPYLQLLEAMMFTDGKRPITAQLLRRISLAAVARELGRKVPKLPAPATVVYS